MDTKYAWSDIIAAMTRIGHGTKATMELKKALKTLTGEEKIQEAKTDIDHYKNLRKVMDVSNELYGAILITIGDLKGPKYDKEKSELIKLRKAIAAAHTSQEKMLKTFKKD